MGLARDNSNIAVPLMVLSAPQTLTVNDSAGAATLSAAIGKAFVRLQPTVDMWVLVTVSTAVTAATGHFCAAGGCYDLAMAEGLTKVSVLGVSGAGTCYLSALG